jgi:subtilase family serine protease
MPSDRSTFIRASLLSLLAATAASAAISVADAAGSGSVAPWVRSAQQVGVARDGTKVMITAYLGFRDRAGLEALVAAQSAPGNAQFGHHLTPAEFRAQFAPAAADVNKVSATLQKLGFTVGHIATSGFYVEASGTVAQIKSAFHVSQNLYKFHGQIMRANAQEPTLPAGLAGRVIFVGGLDETGLLRQPMHVGPDEGAVPAAKILPGPDPILPPSFCSKYWGDHSATVTPAPSPYGGTLPWLNCGYTPQQIRQAYGADKVKFDGTGVRVAIVDTYASPTIVFDADHYFKNHDVPLLNDNNFTQIVPAGIYNVSPSEPCGPQSWFTEESLDVESVHSMAPGAQIFYVGARYCDVRLDDALYDAIDNHVADIITNSWGENGEYSSYYEEQVQNAGFLQAAATGISVLFSSGDYGDLSQFNGVVSGSWPSTSPYVTSVGGTTTALLDATGSKQETGWGTYRAYLTNPTVNSGGTKITDSGVTLPYAFYAGAGGGPSLSQLQPSWQKGVVPSALADTTYSITGEPIPFSEPHRVTPDIALDADPYTGFRMGETFTVVTPGGDPGCVVNTKATNLEYCEFGEGGTSLSSPLFAGVLARVNEQRLANGLGTIGFVNPRLYQLAVGQPGATNTPIIDVLAPSSPVALLRGYLQIPNTVRLVTVNSVPNAACPNGICEGVDDVFLQTTPGYDDVTGIGTPYLPVLLKALGQ